MIRFYSTENYTIEDATGCPVEPTEFSLPIKKGDEVSFMVNKEDIFYRGDDASQVRLGISSCGILLHEDIGDISEGDQFLYCTITIPEDLTGCNYELMFYSTVTPVNCGEYEGATLQDVIDDTITLGDVLQCTLDDFIL